MLSSEKKNRNKTTKKKPSPLLPATPQPTPNPYIPDDLLLSCVPRIRSVLGHREICLYVYLRFYPDTNLRWFTLCRRPNRTLTEKKKKPRSNLLVGITCPHSSPPCASYTAVGSDIYEIGGLINGLASSTVSVFDCRSQSWHQAPSMQVRSSNPEVKAIDGKIYVRNIDYTRLSNLVEVFDPKSETWTYETKEWKSLDGYYKSKEFISRSCWCEIDNVLYYYDIDRGEFKWQDTKARNWRILKGLFGLPNYLFCSTDHSSQVQLADYGGKMAIFWDRHDYSSNCNGRNLWCAVITLERRSSEEIWGTVEWSEVVPKVPKDFTFVDVLSATV
ncbi:unnamed protein product [Microthlaspi erraticum]|uniref:FKB95-like N-terminal Kelch domain-containing protein n=1 Tax=Microthlaspi erraticum TaxID=1685480 RepID=A0A6D2IVM6_9BRAS|nr:unnamed protein product [Microthlaspi erraticum]